MGEVVTQCGRRPVDPRTAVFRAAALAAGHRGEADGGGVGAQVAGEHPAGAGVRGNESCAVSRADEARGSLPFRLGQHRDIRIGWLPGHYPMPYMHATTDVVHPYPLSHLRRPRTSFAARPRTFAI